MSLMEKDNNSKNKEKDKFNFIIKTSALLEVDKIMDDNELEDKEYIDFILNSSASIYEQLLDHKKDNIDSIGVWFTFNDGQEISNSIDLSILEDLRKYGSNDVNPIQEFFKMTLEI